MDGSMMAGDRDTFTFEDMRPDEFAIVKALESAKASGQNVLRIAEIMSANGWDEVEDHECSADHCSVCATALKMGNSKVRNNVRRLVRYGVVCRPLDGAYALVTEQTAPPVAVVVTTVQAAPVRLVVIRPNPCAMSASEARLIRLAAQAENYEPIAKARKLDCTLYNACLSQADSGNWPGFSCTSCAAYSPTVDQYQRELDVLALRAAQTASDELAKNGKINRVRGVKPGPDAKRGTVIDDEEDDDEIEAAY